MLLESGSLELACHKCKPGFAILNSDSGNKFFECVENTILDCVEVEVDRIEFLDN